MSYINGGAMCEHRKHGQELMGYIRGQHAKKPEEFKAYNGCTEMQHLEESVAAVEIILSDEEISFLEEPYKPHPVLGQLTQPVIRGHRK